MYMTREHALGQLCPFSIARKQSRCVADLCMGWRDVTLYVVYRTGERENGEEHLQFQWGLTPAQGAHVVDCGYCGACGPPNMQSGSMAPIGYDEQSLVGLTLTGGRRVDHRTTNALERRLMKERGLYKDVDLTPRSYQGKYAWPGRKGKK